MANVETSHETCSVATAEVFLSKKTAVRESGSVCLRFYLETSRCVEVEVVVVEVVGGLG